MPSLQAISWGEKRQKSTHDPTQTPHMALDYPPIAYPLAIRHESAQCRWLLV